MPTHEELKRIKKDLEPTHSEVFVMFIAPRGLKAMVNSGAIGRIKESLPVPDDMFKGVRRLDLYFVRKDELEPSTDGRPIGYVALSTGGVPEL